MAKAKGFNTVLFGYDLPKAFDLPIQDMLNTTDRENMKVIFEFSYFLRQNATQNVTLYLPELVPHPSIFAWYLIDEPYSYINDTSILELQRLIRDFDERPTFVQFSTQYLTNPELYEDLPGNVTYLSVDPYPQMPHTNHSKVTSWLRSLIEFNQNKSKIWVVLKAEERENVYVMPNENEFRMDVVSALQMGVVGIHWFTFGDYDAPYYGVSLNENAWNIIGKTLDEIKPISKLMLTKTSISPISRQGNLSYSVIHNSTHILVAITNQNYYWNGSASVWNPETENLIIEELGEHKITLNDSTYLLLIEKPSVGEYSKDMRDISFVLASLIVGLLLVRKRNER